MLKDGASKQRHLRKESRSIIPIIIFIYSQVFSPIGQINTFKIKGSLFGCQKAAFYKVAADLANDVPPTGQYETELSSNPLKYFSFGLCNLKSYYLR